MAATEEVWIQTSDEAGDVYYYNNVTLETCWDRPEGVPVVHEDEVEIIEDGDEAAAAAAAAAGGATAAEAEETLVYIDPNDLENWYEAADDAGNKYWYHGTKGLSIWHNPHELLAAQQAAEAASSTPASSSAPDAEMAALQKRASTLQAQNETLQKRVDTLEQELQEAELVIRELREELATAKQSARAPVPPGSSALAVREPGRAPGGAGRASAAAHPDDAQDEGVALMSLLKSISLFHGLNEAQLSRLATALQSESHPCNHIVIQQGDPSEAFYIVAAGRVAVHVQDKSLQRSGFMSHSPYVQGEGSLGPVVAELGQGFFFGERGLMQSTPRAASVVALTKVRLLKLSRAHFSDILASVMLMLDKYGTVHYDSRTPETMALASHVSAYTQALRVARASGSLSTLTTSDDTLPPDRAAADIMSLYSPELGVADVLDRFVESVTALCNAAAARVFMYDSEAGEILVLGRGLDAVDGLSLTGAGVVGAAVQARHTFSVANTASDARFKPGSEAFDPSQPEAAVSMDWAAEQMELDKLVSEVHHSSTDQEDARAPPVHYTLPASGTSMLVVPLEGPDGRILGAVQVLHKVNSAGKARRLSGMGQWHGSGAAGGPKRKLTEDDAESIISHTTDHSASKRAHKPFAPFSSRDCHAVQSVARTLALALSHLTNELDLIMGRTEATPLYSQTSRFRMRVMGGGNLMPPKSWHTKVKNGKWPKPPKDITAVVRMHLFHGGVSLCEAVACEAAPLVMSLPADDAPVMTEFEDPDSVADWETAPRPQVSAMWGQWITGALRLCNLPGATRVIFALQYSDGTDAGWAGCTVFDYNAALRSGKLELRLWPGAVTGEKAGMTTNLTNTRGDPEFTPALHVEFDKFSQPVVKVAGALNVDLSEQQIEDVAQPKSGRQPGGGAGGRAAAHAGRGVSTRKLSLDAGPAAGGDAIPALTHQAIRVAASRSEFEGAWPRLVNLFRRDPLYTMTAEERALVWRCRKWLLDVPDALPKFLLSVAWDDACAVEECHTLLSRWATPEPLDALQLLDYKFPDPKVRAFAVNCLEALSDDDLHQYMLQLTQVLKFEGFMDTALARFLQRRALRHPELLGHVLFWFLKAEMHVPEVSARFAVLIEQYLRNAGSHRTQLGHQMFVMAKLEDTAMAVKTVSKDEQLPLVRRQLPTIVFPAQFQLPISPHMIASSLIVEKCRVMSSKKLPLWLTFRRAEGSPDSDEHPNLRVLFKAGDDLRQDQLTLQLIAVMDRLWKDEDLDLAMSPYRCISTGDEIGMLEVVENSATLAGIVEDEMGGEKRGGMMRKMKAAYDAMTKDSAFLDWLLKQPGNAEDMDGVRDRFARSCAGYCVATYVLGIGDRHNDNLMLTRDGKFFHIDFGHFLGHFKSKFGVKREKAPFVFTRAFAAVLGGVGSPDYNKFEQLSIRAYNILRKHGNLLLTLFFLMMSCGIPELQTESDLHWLRDKLMMDATDEQAAASFREAITESLNTRATYINHAVHSFAHA